MLRRIAESKSNCFIVVLVGFIAGIGAHSFFLQPIFSIIFLIMFAGLVVILLIQYRKNKTTRIILLGGLFFVLGFLRFGFGLNIFNSSIISNGEVISTRGVVVNLPESRRSTKNYVVNIDSIFRDRDWQVVRGRVLLQSRGFEEFSYGDRVIFTCNANQNQKNFLIKYQAGASCLSDETLSLVEHDRGNRVLSFIYDLRENLLFVIHKNIPNPQAGLLSGLLVGERSSFGKNLNDLFRRTGTMHMVAISGWNVALLTIMFFNLLTTIALNRKKAFWVTIVLLISFVFFTGSGASVVRAGIMGGTVMLGKYLGRESNSLRLLIFAAAIMLAINPFLLGHDLGFILSFAATAGLVVFGPYFKDRLNFIPQDFKIRETLSETAAATFATLPFTIFSFGQISLIAPVSNLFVMLLVPHAMWTGFLAAVLNFIPFISTLLDLTSWIILSSILGFISFFGNLSFASVRVGSYSILLSIFLGLVLVFVLFRVQNIKFKTQRHSSPHH